MRRFIVSPFATVALAIVLVAALGSVANACPTCGEALGHQDAAHNGVAKGFYYSILFMMGTPYLVLGTFCGCMYWKVRRTRTARASQGTVAKDRPAEKSPAAAPALRRDESCEPVEV
jgi:hypothetical protein